MKKIFKALLPVIFFGACTKEKAIPSQPKKLQSESNSNIATSSGKKLTATTENEEDLVKKKVAKVKYPKTKQKN